MDTASTSRRGDAMLEKGDLDGQRVWLRIMEAVQELQRTEPPARTHVN